MTHAPRWKLFPLIVIFAVLLALYARTTSPGHAAENYFQDAVAGFLAERIDSDITIIAIDSRSISELQRWPWPRAWHARLLRLLREANPAKVFYDVDFSAPSDATNDRALIAEIDQWSAEHLALPAFWQPSTDGSGLILTQPLAALRDNATIASVNLRPGPDSIVRHVRTSWSIGDVALPAVMRFAGERPVAEDRVVPIDFSIAPHSFRIVSFVDVLDGVVPAEDLQGRRVYVGATAVELGDMIAVPIYGSLPGVVVQAIATATLDRGPIEAASFRLTTIALVCWCVALVALFYLVSWRKGALVLASGALVLAAAFVYLQYGHRIAFEFVPFIVAGLGSSIFALCAALDQKTVQLWLARLHLGRRRALLESILESSTDCIVRITPEGRIEAANSAAEALLGRDRSDLIGRGIDELLPELPADALADGTVSLSDFAGKIRELDIVRADGEWIPVEVSLSESRYRDERMYVAIVRDISWRKAKEQELAYRAAHDALTDLPNRHALKRRLREALTSQNDENGVALLLLDLDRFKEVNDTLGHSVGDDVLRDVSRRFAWTAGDDAFVSRLGGDEFAVVLQDADPQSASTQMAQSLIRALQAPLDAEGVAIELGVSIGIAFYPADGSDADMLLKNADIAMYSAKNRGGGYAFYDSAHDKHSVRRLGLLGELRSTIENDGLSLSFQPKIDLRSGDVHGAEALLRWEHPELGRVNPEEFIGIIEATDLIQPLTDWTLRAAFDAVKEWRRNDIDGPVAVNLSTRLLQDARLPERLRQLVREAGVKESDLELEITESAVMLDPERAIDVIKRISETGIRVSIDDFGTGYSSLAYLRDMPLRSIKIDKSFVINMADRRGDRVIVDSTIRMAQALGLKVVAEGVESAWAEDYLKRAGCEFAQGFQYSPALPAEEFVAWCRRHDDRAANDALSESAIVRMLRR